LVKFGACVEMIFSDAPFLKRLERVREAGLSAFEFWGWMEKDIEAIDRRRRELGLQVTSFVAQPQPSSLTMKDVSTEFKRAVMTTLDVAQKLECDTIIAPVGLGRGSIELSRKEQLRNAEANFRPVNPLDHEGCFLTRCDEGAQLIRAIKSPNVKLLYDFYHQQISEGNLIENARKYFDLIGLFHVGDVPGRHEPGTGEINYRNVFKFLDGQGYKKHASLEFVPTIDPVEAVRRTVLMAE